MQNVNSYISKINTGKQSNDRIHIYSSHDCGQSSKTFDLILLLHITSLGRSFLKSKHSFINLYKTRKLIRSPNPLQKALTSAETKLVQEMIIFKI